MKIRLMLAAAASSAALLAASLPVHAAPAELAWAACPGSGFDGFECASLTVPRDWAHPDAGTMEIAMARHRSTGTKAERIGSLFFNPGGPGGAGVPAAAYAWSILPNEIQQRFDLVTWDPRGVGGSEGLDDCVPAVVPRPAPTGPVDWVALQARTRTAIAKVNAACQAAHPQTVAHMGTNANVEDLDAMRAAVGDESLNYWAWSYGTRIGYVYALKHSDTVRALILDGSTTPNGTVLNFSGPYSTAADAGFNILFQARPQAAADYRIAHAALAARPVRLSPTRVLTQWDVDLFLQEWVSWEDKYDLLAQYLANARVAATGTGEARRAAIASLAAIPAAEATTMSGAAAIIQCTDYAERATFARSAAVARASRLSAPIAGWFRGIATSMPCQGLDIAADPVPAFTGTDWKTRVLMLGATFDSQTPYQWTAAMSTLFRAGRVITYVGAKHVTLGSGSACVDQFAIDYLVDGTLPAMDASCPNIAAAGAATSG